MKRRDFFRKLGISVGAVAVAPSVLSQSAQPEPPVDPLLHDLTTFLPMGQKSGYGYDELVYPDIKLDVNNKKILISELVGRGRIPIMHIYEQVMNEFDEMYLLDEETAMTAITPSQYELHNGWDFGFNSEKICHGAWGYSYKDEAYTSVYGLGYINEEYLKFEYMLKTPNRTTEWRLLGNGVSYRNDKWDKSDPNRKALFDRNVRIKKSEETTVIIGVFDSNHEMVDVFGLVHKGFPYRHAYPFHGKYPIDLHTRKLVRKKFKDLMI